MTLRIRYAPEGGTPQEWTFVPRRTRQSEAEMIEKQAKARDAGNNFAEFLVHVKAGQAAALKVMLWHLTRRDHPGVNLRIEDVPDFYMGEVTVALDLDELLEARELAVANKHMFTDAEFAAGLAEVDAEIAELRGRGEVESGKASSNSGDASTSSPSPTTSD